MPNESEFGKIYRDGKLKDDDVAMSVRVRL